MVNSEVGHAYWMDESYTWACQLQLEDRVALSFCLFSSSFSIPAIVTFFVEQNLVFEIDS